MGIENSFRKSGKMFNEIPHVIIGGNKDKNEDTSPFKAWKNGNNQQVPYKDPIDVKIEQIKKFGIIFVVTMVILYAAYRILRVFF